jgi:DNA-binding transcriptional ArsR family regulator
MATDQLSVTFAALADPTRRAILARLTEGDANVSELAAPFSISLPAISRHLKVLERAGLISRGRSAQWRSSSLQAEPLRDATAWMERYRQFWDANFDRLDAHLQRMQQAPQAHSAQAQSDQARANQPPGNEGTAP